MKRIISVLICLVIMLASFSVMASAVDTVKIEQAFVQLPEITAVVKPKSSKQETYKKEDFSGKFGGEKLQVAKVEEYDKQKHTSTIYVLVDASNSIGSSSHKEIKKKLVAMSDNLTSKETLVLISFGNKVKTVLKGGEDKQTRKEKINSLPTEEGETNLFNAIKEAVRMSQSDTAKPTDRSYAIVISDGENFETNGGSTFEEAKKSVEGHGLPIYALCVEGSSSNSSEFGAFARESGGEIFTADYSSQVSSSFDNLVTEATSEILVLSLLTEKNNPSDGSAKNLMIRVKDKSANIDVKATRWIKDDTAPQVEKIETVKNEEGVIQVKISYTENVLKADNPENIKLTRKDGKKEYKFKDAEYYFTVTGEYYTLLTPEKEIPKHDDYSVVFANVTDSSNEQNKIQTDGTKYEVGARSGFVVFLAGYWWIFLVILALAAGAIVTVLVIKSAKEKKAAAEAQNASNMGAEFVDFPVQDYPPIADNIGYGDSPQVITYETPADVQMQSREKYHIKAPNGKRLTLKIICKDSPERVVNTTIVDKITIGRSEKCDVYLDDMKMSRVHFELINRNGEIYVNDLGSANGTLVNKMKISTKRKIGANDEIVAGHSKFRVVF